MTIINETLQPDESFAGRGQKVKSFGSKASISCRRDGRDPNRQPISTQRSAQATTEIRGEKKSDGDCLPAIIGKNEKENIY